MQHYSENSVEELFIENFFNRNQAKSVEAFPLENSNERKLEPLHEKFSQQNSSSTLDMLIFLDRLELEIEKEYLDFADYRCLFNKIRTEFKKNSVNGVLNLLNDLEDLLDLGVASLALKKV